jgi:hypothetical protein
VHIVKALKESGADVPKELEDMTDSSLPIAKCGAEKYYGVGSGDVAVDRKLFRICTAASKLRTSLSGFSP